MKAPAPFASLLARKPVRVATVAMANKMARIVWALMTPGRNVSRSTYPGAGCVRDNRFSQVTLAARGCWSDAM